MNARQASVIVGLLLAAALPATAEPVSPDAVDTEWSGETSGVHRDEGLQPVPEPATLAMFGIGLTIAAGAVRRRACEDDRQAGAGDQK